MRNAFAAEFTELAERDESLVLLMADIGNHLFDRYRERYPDRFYNCGVAEANMIGVAAGLASCGLRPVCYTITPFATTRCLEQIRVDLCYHHMPAIVVGTGAGLSYASLGATHHSCEDIAMLRVLPGIKVLCPGDPLEVRACLRAAVKTDGPVYMRIGKKGEPAVHEEIPEIRIGQCIVIKEGTSVGLLNAGNTLPLAVQAATKLGSLGFSTEVASFHTVKPLDESYLADAFNRFQLIATLEEHSTLGGLGGSVAEWVCDKGDTRAPLIRFGTGDEFLHGAGDQEYARKRYGLTVEHIVDKIVEKLR
jgi:transketolase